MLCRQNADYLKEKEKQKNLITLYEFIKVEIKPFNFSLDKSSF